MSTRPSSRVADVWANWWDAAFFAVHPPTAALYARLGLSARAGLAVDDLLSEARAGGLARILISATAFPGSPVDNRAVARLVARAPELLAGCASVDPREGMRAVRELRRAVREDGFRALKLLPFLYDEAPNARSYYPLYAECIELGIPVLVLTGHTAVLARSEVGRPAHLDDVALFFPELTIVAGHAGYPWTDELISLAWKHANLYIDTSGHRPKYFPPALTHFLNSYGREKVLFGTGYPLMDYAGPLGELRALGLRPESLEKVLWGNAARIWGWT
ncbi:MAG: amidohydrolase [Gammaproteobacteria bacterium]|nr:amidohydrolase [Gammaproteobacteria bacterium]